jgi:hypothetical protein
VREKQQSVLVSQTLKQRDEDMNPSKLLELNKLVRRNHKLLTGKVFTQNPVDNLNNML